LTRTYRYPAHETSARRANLARPGAQELLPYAAQEVLMHVLRSSGLVSIIACAAACSTSAPSRTPVAPAAAEPPVAITTQRALRDLCPMEVPGATVRAEDIETGAALVFVTSGIYGGDIADLRRRVREMADIHNHYRDWMTERMPDRAMLPPSKRHIDDLPTGARIVFEPGNESGMLELRERVRVEAQRIAAGTCPIAMPRDPIAGPTDTRLVTR
jgi:hypothetical protein